MTIKQIVILAVTPLALLAAGVFGLRVAGELSARLGSESLTQFVRAALDRPDKLSPDHVKTVLRSAETIERLELATQAGTIRLLETFARACLGLALVSGITIVAAFRTGREPRTDRGDGSARG